MSSKQARADVAHIRQTTQFTCCAASIAAALKAHGKDVTEDQVNQVLGAAPMAGATWEAMLATVQYFGLRGSLVVPSTPRMLKEWTDQGLPVLIAWNPENRPWSHASVVFDVVEGADGILQIHVMDPNIPNPSRHVRVLNEDEFCPKWGEKVSDTLIVRRPAMVVEREVTAEGRQVRASVKIAEEYDCLKDYQAGGLTWAEYQDCLKRFRTPSAPKAVVAVPADYAERAARLLMVVWFHEAKAKDFLKRNLYASQLSPKQLQWFDALERKYRRDINDMPNRPNLLMYTDGSLGVQGATASEIAKMEKHFDLIPGNSERERVLMPLGSQPKEHSHGSGIQWQRRGQGWAYNSEDVSADVFPAEAYEEFRDPNIPSWSDLTNDGEMFADAIPELMAQGQRIERDLEQWNRQGWWPNRRKIKVWRLLIHHRGRDKFFEADFKSEREAMARAEEAIPKIRDMKRPPWLLPAKEANMKSAKKPAPVQDSKKNPNQFQVEGPAQRNPVVQMMIERSQGAGKHHNREDDVARGRSRKEKHKRDWREKDAVDNLVARYLASKNQE